MSKKQHEEAVSTAKKALDVALKSKQHAQDALTEAQAAIDAADEVSTVAQKRHATAQSALNVASTDPKNTIADIKELREELEEAVVQSGDASATLTSSKRDILLLGQNARKAADNVKNAEAVHWRTVWQQAAEAAREAAAEHLQRSWAAGLFSDFEPGQFDSFLRRTFEEPDETESRALLETLR